MVMCLCELVPVKYMMEAEATEKPSFPQIYMGWKHASQEAEDLLESRLCLVGGLLPFYRRNFRGPDGISCFTGSNPPTTSSTLTTRNSTSTVIICRY
jgi:hypothetical protein